MNKIISVTQAKKGMRVVYAGGIFTIRKVTVYDGAISAVIVEWNCNASTVFGKDQEFEIVS